MNGVRSGIFSLVFLAFWLAASGGVFAAKPSCGDNKCNGGETALTCPADCSDPGFCGDGICGGDESCSSCETDCGVCPPVLCNNDGFCNLGEDCLGCPGDCPGVTGGKPSNRYCCGLEGFCGDFEGQCGPSCGSLGEVCGNGILEPGEECDDGNLTAGDGCGPLCLIESPGASVPSNQFNAGDSIGEGEAADGTINEPHHETVWSTGYAAGDVVSSLNERLDDSDSAAYYENNLSRDPVFNHAISGAVMADFPGQAGAIVTAAAGTGGAGMVSVLMGSNDVCADSLAEMTPADQFESQYLAGLDALAADPLTRDAVIRVSSLPAIYWLWNAKRTDFLCRVFIWPFVPCQNLLADAADDCASTASREDPDVIYAGDGSGCVRRKQFHARIRDVYNPILRDLLSCYNGSSTAPSDCPNFDPEAGELVVKLPNAEYVDIFDVRFGDSHVNDGDCFHPSEAGHALLAEKQWCSSLWGAGDPMCSP